MTTTTTTKDFWKDGYEAPCKANGYQSNHPGAFAIDLHYGSEHNLRWWLVTTERDLEKVEGWNKFEKRRLESQLYAVNEEIAWRKANH